MQIQCKLIKESREWPHCEPVLQILPWNSMPFFRSFDYQRGKNTWTRGNPNLLQLCKGFNGASAWSLIAVVVNSDPVVSHVLGQGYASVPVKPWAHLLAVTHGLPEEGGLQTVTQDRHHLGGSQSWERLQSLGSHRWLGGKQGRTANSERHTPRSLLTSAVRPGANPRAGSWCLSGACLGKATRWEVSEWNFSHCWR